ncbi:Uncharacterized protein SCF082_LOCUS13930 [Durusdinium trenchii]|uniref:Transmembrane protein n=1 Tax=Durusdinium trenchii TaxID=1381693 RepID=A0ABP0JUF4_9DINO
MDESHRSGEGNQSGNQDTENTQGEADRLREAKQTKVAEKVARMDICMAEVLRATRAHQAFQNTAEALRPDFGGNFYSKSFMTEEITCFWSHSWHGGHWMKVMTLLIHYNGQAAVLFGSLFALVATVCFSLGLLPGMVRFPEAPDMQWSTWSLASGFTAAVFVLVLWRPQQLIFLDRICINNSDAEQKKASILSLGGILKRSQRLMVLWDPSWCDRLWCLFELAAFLKSKQAQKNQVLLVQPTILGPCSLINFFCVSFVMLPATTISFAGGSFGLVVPALGVVLFLLISGCFVFAVLRAYFRSLEALKERLQNISFDHCRCACCDVDHIIDQAPVLCDREIVKVLEVVTSRLQDQVFTRQWILAVHIPILWAFFDFVASYALMGEYEEALPLIIEGLVIWFCCSPIFVDCITSLACRYSQKATSTCWEILTNISLVLLGSALFSVTGATYVLCQGFLPLDKNWYATAVFGCLWCILALGHFCYKASCRSHK